jgi:hypothetical protein
MNGFPWPLVKTYFWLKGGYSHLHHFFIPLLKKKNDPKVFCVGAVKTGSSSLTKALNILGYRTIQNISIKEPKEGWVNYIKNSNFDFWADWPMRKKGLYKEIDKTLPNSKFILTIRDKESWAKSYKNYFERSPWEIKNPQVFEKRLKTYEQQNNEIIKYFKDKPSQFLIVDIIKGAGWNEICNFLDKPIPNKPFPHKRKGKYKKKPNVAQ